MNVRIHFRDFSVKDYQNVKEIQEFYRGERIELLDQSSDTLECFDAHTITSIEVRP